MSVYSVKGKGWRYDFTLRGERYTEAWFKTMTEARTAEVKRREEVKKQDLEGLATPGMNLSETVETPTDTDFLAMVNKRLDYVKNYNSKLHFKDVLYHARRWVKEWNGNLACEITRDMIEGYVLKRARISAIVANKELQYLRALFNYGKKRRLVDINPTDQIAFLPIEKRKKYVPPKEDVLKVINVANPDVHHYLWTILLTAGRVNEINQLKWDDVSLRNRQVTLWTRKRKGGNREPREIPMVPMLHELLSARKSRQNDAVPWVFWHRYWSREQHDWVVGPYSDRKKIMGTLCKEAGVRYFRYHAFRHLTASILDDLGVPIGVIQRILGHQNRKTTEIYLHSVGNAEREAMNKLQELDILTNGFTVKQDAPINMPATYWQRKVQRPSLDELKSEVKRLGFKGAGRKYGVSDNAIRKWLKSSGSQHLADNPKLGL